MRKKKEKNRFDSKQLRLNYCEFQESKQKQHFRDISESSAVNVQPKAEF